MGEKNSNTRRRPHRLKVSQMRLNCVELNRSIVSDTVLFRRQTEMGLSLDMFPENWVSIMDRWAGSFELGLNHEHTRLSFQVGSYLHGRCSGDVGGG